LEGAKEVMAGEQQPKKKKKKKGEKKDRTSTKSNIKALDGSASKCEESAKNISKEKESESTSMENRKKEYEVKEKEIQNEHETTEKTDHDGKISEDSKPQDCEFDSDNEDDRKIFLSRIPNTFNEDSITRIFSKVFGENCTDHIALSTKREEDIDNANFQFHHNREEDNDKDRGHQEFQKNMNQDSTFPHRGFAFITMSSVELRNEAIRKGTVRGKAKEASKRKHTMYIRPVVRSNEEGEEPSAFNTCFLWSKYRCPYGNECKFNHIGEGGCLQSNAVKDPASRLKKQRCFSFRTRGKCKLGDNCPYSHDFKVKSSNSVKECIKIPREKVCINWKSKGKCRKGDKCPFRHDESVREAFLAKKEKKKKRSRNDNPQPLSVRVFGLNYDTKEEDVREFFQHCGLIREIAFPTFEDSGRSKGYCGVLFTSPKATEKATDMDGSSLHGRWLSIQSGKMYLKQWQEREEERVKEKKENVALGEFGQKVKKRKKHGFKDN